MTGVQWQVDSHGDTWEEKPKVVLYQGSIAQGRGLLSLIGSLAHLPDNVYLAMVGPQEPEFVSQARHTAGEAGVQDRILWFDAVPRQQLDSFTVSADVGVMFYEPTCRNNYLCAPNKLYDYMMAGLPVVASDLPEPRRVLDETGAGVAVDSSQPNAIAAGIRHVLSNRKRWEAMSAEGRQAAVSHLLLGAPGRQAPGRLPHRPFPPRQDEARTFMRVLHAPCAKVYRASRCCNCN